MHLAILTQQVSHYHAARFRAAHEAFRRITVLSVRNAADFAQLLAGPGVPSVTRVCEGEADYAGALADGTLTERVGAALGRCRPDVVAVAGWSFAESLAAIVWAKRHGSAVVMMSDSQAHDGPRSGWRERVKSRVVRCADAALVAGAPHRAYAAALGLDAERIFLGYDAVDNAHFAGGADAARAHAPATRAAEELPGRYLLASGRFVAKKNLCGLIDAFAAALAQGDTGHDLLVLGDGPERTALEAAVARHGLGARVHLPGFRDYNSLPAIYGLADAFVHVARAEQWGLVISEAAAAGVPLIVSRPCGAADALVRPGLNGWLVDPHDGAGVAAALAASMALPAASRAAMGAASRTIAADWGPERYADGLKRAVAAALAAPRRRLGPLDTVLLRALSRKRIAKVA
ncbi:glycosyltransferase [Acuticoccus sp.]|uniref:glycosyltransferase n=1 Tax=Acuticoccus sp. TaxID=1904378 RepID=UPI003B530350